MSELEQIARDNFETAQMRQARLDAIAQIIRDVDNRCLAADGSVTSTMQEMTQAEMSSIYSLASGNAHE